jgi:hypothetical protein
MNWRTWSPSETQLTKMGLALEIAGEILPAAWRVALTLAALYLAASIIPTLAAWIAAGR